MLHFPETREEIVKIKKLEYVCTMLVSELAMTW